MKKNHAVRLFIALDLPEPVKKIMNMMQQTLQTSHLFVGNAVRPENLHITLKFIGNVDEGLVEHIHESLQRVSFSPFNISLDELGTFDEHHQTDIIWVSFYGQGLVALQHAIEQQLAWLIKPDDRIFIFHSTIIRVKTVADQPALTKLLHAIPLEKTTLVVHQFLLQQSIIVQEERYYKTLFSYKAL